MGESVIGLVEEHTHPAAIIGVLGIGAFATAVAVESTGAIGAESVRYIDVQPSIVDEIAKLDVLILITEEDVMYYKAFYEVAKVAIKRRILVIGVVITDAVFECEDRAFASGLFACSDCIVTLPYEKASEIMCITRTLHSMLDANNIIKLDIVDLRNVLGDSGTAWFGRGGAGGTNKGARAGEDAINQYRDSALSVNSVKRILVFARCPDSDSFLFDLERAAAYIKNLTPDDTAINIGAMLDDTLDDEMIVDLIITC